VQSRRRLEGGTGWFLVAVGALFGCLWLATLLPFALGGDRPDPEGPGGAPYPVFVLDPVVALPCVVAVGTLLVRWLTVLADTFDAVRPTFWPDETEPLPAIMRP
jgi:hypothetical protein